MVVASPAQITPAPSSIHVQHLVTARSLHTPTCGWVSADPAYPNICFPGQTCAVNTFYSVHECCSGAQCTDVPFPTACVGAATSCDSDCQSNPLILKCDELGYDYCATRTWLGSVEFSGFGCTAVSTQQTVYTTNTAGYGQTAEWYTFGEQAAVTQTSSSSRQQPPSSLSSTNARSPSASTSSASSTNAANHSGTMSSQAVTALAATLGVVVGLSLFLGLGFLLYRRKRRMLQDQTHGDNHLSDRSEGSDTVTFLDTATDKSYTLSSTAARSPDERSYRSTELPHESSVRFELDGDNTVAELSGMHPPGQYGAKDPAIEADSVNVCEAPAGKY